MTESKSISALDDPSDTFVGIRFVLVGFDPVREDKVRSKLLERGAIDALDYGPDCNLVVVDNIVYDDPICVAARRDDKILVTGLWVDYSFDMGMPVDPNYILYRPVRDLNGIPGAKSLVMCLTGYQGHDRNHIMVMVALMGARFSKPLVANKVTHLICYKFEGEKYEVGKKIQTMKLVNHRWLEDCLKAWELLPEANYAKSGYELEMEAEVRDSEEETEDGASVDPKKNSNTSPQNPRLEYNFDHSPKQQEASRNSVSLTAFENSAHVGNSSKTKSIRQEANNGNTPFPRETRGSSVSPMLSSSPKILMRSGLATKPIEMSVSRIDGSCRLACDVSPTNGSSYPRKNRDEIESSGVNTPLEEQTDSLPCKKRMTLSCGRSKPTNIPGCLMEETGGVFSMQSEKDQDRIDSSEVKTPLKGALLHLNEEETSTLPRENKVIVSHGSSKLTRLSNSPKTLMGSGSVTKASEVLVSGSKQSAIAVSPPTNTTSPLTEEVLPEDRQEVDDQTPKRSRKRPKKQRSPNLEVKDPSMSNNREEMQQNDQQSVEPHFPSINTKVNKLDGQTDLNSSKVDHSGPQSKSPKKLTISHGSSKSRRLSNSPKTSMGSGLVTEASKMPVSGSSIHYSKQPAIDVSPPTNTTSPLIEALASKEALAISALDGQEFNTQTLKRSRGRPKKQKLPNLEVKGPSLSMAESCSGGKEMQQNDKKSIEPQLPNSSSRVDILDGQADLNSTKVDHSDTDTQSKPPKRLGSGPTIRKGLISAALQKELRSHSKGVTAIGDANNVSLAEKFVAVSPTTNEDIHVGNDNEASRCEGPNEFLDVGAKISAQVEESHSGKRNQPSEKATEIQKRAKSEAKKSNEAKDSVSSPKAEFLELKEKGITKNKRPLAKSKINKLRDTKQDEKTASGNEENIVLAGKTGLRPSKKLKGSGDVEKENEPATNGKQSSNHDTNAVEKENEPVTNGKQSSNHDTNAVEKENIPVTNGKQSSNHDTNGCEINKANTEVASVCFILSGHRLQRKEFQKVIKRLKGRVCRDTHSWSYQATHFIVPDPIRRTEKFFAAAASGSWILKTDYLSASNEAGKLLSEEPFEWHKKGLTEDGAISLEAPRKWRLLRERTGNGAFYGMRVIVYGECIAPPLDTLKRVVKAGGGAILATSPPYSRFLGSNVDFAVVSPGMPPVDMWVQEFLRHEIPCVSADYLVEYVCKPGFSLERHVMYGTHAWAQRSLESLVEGVEG